MISLEGPDASREKREEFDSRCSVGKIERSNLAWRILLVKGEQRNDCSFCLKLGRRSFLPFFKVGRNFRNFIKVWPSNTCENLYLCGQMVTNLSSIRSFYSDNSTGFIMARLFSSLIVARSPIACLSNSAAFKASPSLSALIFHSATRNDDTAV